MKRILLFLTLGLCVFLNANGLAQSKTIPGSFTIIDNKQPEKADFYTKAIEAADMEKFRLRDERVQLKFENGFLLELLSAKEVFIKSGQIDINSYLADKTQGNNVSTLFSIGPDGWITVAYDKKYKKGKN